MTNVIRPTFGRPPQPDAEVPEEIALEPLRIYGEAAGHVVALVADPGSQAGEVLKVVVGPLVGDRLEAVAVLPRTEAGEIDAERVGMAVLRTLELLE
ncbi:hypothetical protein FV222_22660 [Methylobacterium sp. WL103]|uniref:hypothetical protein n=1 Tax=Methylobacterium sp. WL103 TaxID=2603891 RepID=UPI0011C92D80|nr:hypothetical protein [Methylobacterium sp. WL103]TXM93103.1 hypothetical protein FV222_22660 [Methylobacterium sp. WL103]